VKYVNIHIFSHLTSLWQKETAGDGKKLLTYLNSALKVLSGLDIFPRGTKKIKFCWLVLWEINIELTNCGVRLNMFLFLGSKAIIEGRSNSRTGEWVCETYHAHYCIKRGEGSSIPCRPMYRHVPFTNLQNDSLIYRTLFSGDSFGPLPYTTNRLGCKCIYSFEKLKMSWAPHDVIVRRVTNFPVLLG
jgi:hypothetical protein